jgi:hypothetical protein
MPDNLPFWCSSLGLRNLPAPATLVALAVIGADEAEIDDLTEQEIAPVASTA